MPIRGRQLHLPLTHHSWQGVRPAALYSTQRGGSFCQGRIGTLATCPYTRAHCAVSASLANWLALIGLGFKPMEAEARGSFATVQGVQPTAYPFLRSNRASQWRHWKSSPAFLAGHRQQRTAILCTAPCTFLGRNRWSTRCSWTVLVRLG